MERSVKFIACFVFSVMLGTSCLGCGSGSSTSNDSEASQNAQSNNSETQATEQANQYDSRQSVSLWAQEVFEETMENMEAEAGFDYVPGEHPTFATGFENTQDFGCIPLFENTALRDQLVSVPFTPQGKVITGSSDNNSFYAYDTPKEDRLPGQPRFQYWEFEEADPSLFADTVEECTTLVVYKGLESKVDENYYEDGSDRIQITTYVFVIDVAERRLLHIKAVSSNSPGVITTSNVGTVDTSGAFIYMAELFGIPPA